LDHYERPSILEHHEDDFEMVATKPKVRLPNSLTEEEDNTEKGKNKGEGETNTDNTNADNIESKADLEDSSGTKPRALAERAPSADKATQSPEGSPLDDYEKNAHGYLIVNGPIRIRKLTI
jgi:hypothetical protein